MRLRTKFLIALLCFSLVPLLGQGLLYHCMWDAEIQDSVRGNLHSVASAQQARIAALFERNAERLALIASRTQLRLSLRQFLRSGDPEAHARMGRILADAAGSLSGLEDVSIHGNDGRGLVNALAGRGPVDITDASLLERARRGPVLDELRLGPDGNLELLLAGPLELDGERLGIVLLRTRGRAIFNSLREGRRLGDSGEVLLVRQAAEPVVLAPTRFYPGAAMQPLSSFPDAPPEAGQLFGPDGESEGLDYRGRHVLVARTRVPHSDWQIVVKLDRDEAYGTCNRTAVLAGGIIVLVGLVAGLLALVFARRLTGHLAQLSHGVAALRRDRFDGRVELRSRDEIGGLADSFNAMAEHIEEARSELAGKVAELERENGARQALEADRERVIRELQEALSEIQTLEGIIPICASCKKIRDDKGYWNQLESYVAAHSKARFSHGLCPDCTRAAMEDVKAE